MMKYIGWMKENGTKTEKALGSAAEDYFTAARIYFNYHADGLSVSDAVDEVTADILSSYAAGRSGALPEGVSIRGISAMLESDNTLRLYYNFNNDEGPAGYTFMIDGSPADLIQRSDGAYYLAMKTGVYSDHLQDTHTYTVSDSEKNTYTITASVLTYARSCAIKSNKKESDLGKALYLYNQAAAAEFGQ